MDLLHGELPPTARSAHCWLLRGDQGKPSSGTASLWYSQSLQSCCRSHMGLAREAVLSSQVLLAARVSAGPPRQGVWTPCCPRSVPLQSSANPLNLDPLGSVRCPGTSAPKPRTSLRSSPSSRSADSGRSGLTRAERSTRGQTVRERGSESAAHFLCTEGGRGQNRGVRGCLRAPGQRLSAD
ncbi:unnamed protein product, partial [Gadus morhua 'NCC']